MFRSKRSLHLRRNIYDAGDILGFSALFPEIGEDKQARHYRKIYEDDKIDFFACTMEYMDWTR